MPSAEVVAIARRAKNKSLHMQLRALDSTLSNAERQLDIINGEIDCPLEYGQEIDDQTLANELLAVVKAQMFRAEKAEAEIEALRKRVAELEGRVALTIAPSGE